MIYPTRLAIVLTAIGAPVALLIGLIAPGYWAAAGAWLAMIFGLVLLDALIGPSRGAAQLILETPGSLGMAGKGTMTVRATFERSSPREAQLAVETNARLTVSPDYLVTRFSPDGAAAGLELTPVRRGEGEVTGLWMRWRGPLGLVWKQVREEPARKIPIVPNVQAVKDEAIRLFSRDAMFGIKSQLETGDGSEFHALRELVGGMDPRTIDWKQSARHAKLLAK
jgi:uncharacterized protein (DUF58 family)